jgi:hypothetical protein
MCSAGSTYLESYRVVWKKPQRPGGVLGSGNSGLSHDISIHLVILIQFTCLKFLKKIFFSSTFYNQQCEQPLIAVSQSCEGVVMAMFFFFFFFFSRM